MFINAKEIARRRITKIVAAILIVAIILTLSATVIVLGLQLEDKEDCEQKSNQNYPSGWFGIGNLTSYRLIDENVYEVKQIKTFNINNNIEYWYKRLNNGVVKDAVMKGQPVSIYGRLIIEYTVDLNKATVITKDTTVNLKDFVVPEIPDVELRYNIPESVIYSETPDISNCMVQFGNTDIADAVKVIGPFASNHVAQTLILNITINGNTESVTINNYN